MCCYLLKFLAILCCIEIRHIDVCSSHTLMIFKVWPYAQTRSTSSKHYRKFYTILTTIEHQDFRKFMQIHHIITTWRRYYYSLKLIFLLWCQMCVRHLESKFLATLCCTEIRHIDVCSSLTLIIFKVWPYVQTRSTSFKHYRILHIMLTTIER